MADIIRKQFACYMQDSHPGGVPTSRIPASPPVPPTLPLDDGTSVEETVLATLVSLGRLVRRRYPGDRIDFTALPLLKVLDHHGPMRISMVAAQLGLDASTVSRHARHLEDQGLLERADDPDDGRASRVMVTGHGRACLVEAAASRRDAIGRILAGWSERDRADLKRLLTLLHDDLTRTQETL